MPGAVSFPASWGCQGAWIRRLWLRYMAVIVGIRMAIAKSASAGADVVGLPKVEECPTGAVQ